MAHTPRYCLVALLLASASLLAAAEPPKATFNPSVPAQVTVPPPGDYRVVQLVLENAKIHEQLGQYFVNQGVRGPDAVITAATRDGKIRMPSRLSVRDIVGELKIDGATIEGVYRYQQVRSEFERELILSATVADGVISGTWKVGDGQHPRSNGKLTGFVRTEAELARMNRFATKADWPCYSGPTTSLAATPCGLKLVDDFSKLTPVWRSEEMVPHGNGNAMNGPKMLSTDRTMGGGASLVVSDGRVICSYYQPAGNEFADAKGWYSVWSKVPPTGNPAEDVKHLMVNAYKVQPDHPQWRWMVEKLLLRADEVYLCIDAATGKTLWKTVFPEATQMQYGHKQGPVNNTPCIGDGRVYVLSTIGTLRALDLATGKQVWELPGALPNVCGGDKDGNNAPIFVGKTVVTGNHRNDLIGVDAATGKKLWTLPGKSYWLQVPAKWAHGGQEYAISLSAPGALDEKNRPAHTVLCVEPQTGKVLWEAPVPPAVSKGVSVFGNVLYVASGAAGGPGKPNPDGVTTAYTLSVEGIKQLWQAPTPYYSGNDFPVTDGKVVVLGGIDRSVLLDAATGKELATYVGPGPYNEGHTTLCEDRVLLSIDGSHGGNHFVPLDASPAAFSKPLNPGWIPPHPPTTAYHNKPMTWPVVEGRLFMRGHDGVYCYDLRQMATK